MVVPIVVLYCWLIHLLIILRFSWGNDRLKYTNFFLTPPFGFTLFIFGVLTVVRTMQMYKGVIPFIAFNYWRWLWVLSFSCKLLPNRMSLLSETSPQGPKLQYCIEKYVGENVFTKKMKLKAQF